MSGAEDPLIIACTFCGVAPGATCVTREQRRYENGDIDREHSAVQLVYKPSAGADHVTAVREQARAAADLMEQAEEAAQRAIFLMTESRYARNMRANEAAALLGISPQYMSDLENARRGVSLQFLRKLEHWR